MDAWSRKELWKRQGKAFTVEVSRHEVPLREESSGCYDAEGVHRWCVYVYVYPKHPEFERFDPSAPMHEQPSFGVHGGVSFFRAHRKDDGEIASFQVGGDYNHLHDWHYTQMENPADARSVFADADEIFDYLKSREDAPQDSTT